MGDSAAGLPASPEANPDAGLRASDADREAVVTRLQDEYVAGRLSHETFLHRVNSVLDTKHKADLPAHVADLPGPAAPRRAWLRTAIGTLAARVMAAWRSGAARPAAQPSPRLTTGIRLTSGIPGYYVLPVDGPPPLRFPEGEASSFSIGRDASCDLAISDMSVSRLHARLERGADGWLLIDLGSTNGTRVNGWRVKGRTPVRPGDIVTFGYASYALTGPGVP